MLCKGVMGLIIGVFLIGVAALAIILTITSVFRLASSASIEDLRRDVRKAKEKK